MRVIVHADDYGLTEKVSEGILYGMKHGVITDTSAIVCTDAFAESAKFAIKEGVQGMGLHALLTMGKPILSPSLIPTLINEQGNFYDPKWFANQLKQQVLSYEEVAMELEAQIQEFLSSGLRLTHIDTHHCFMMRNDAMFAIFVEMANRYRVPLRNEMSLYSVSNQRLYEATLQQNHITCCNYVYFARQKPFHTVDALKEILSQALQQYHTIEIGCHPGYCDVLLKSISPLHEARELELQTMLDDSLKRFLFERKIELINYEELLEGEGRQCFD